MAVVIVTEEVIRGGVQEKTREDVQNVSAVVFFLFCVVLLSSASSFFV
jgi:hypothetical protein